MTTRPESTYRLQFHAGFTFRDAAAIVPYLHDLGITHVYASPYLKARPGSTHGYDVIDHCALNPELGTEADYDAFVNALADRGMGHVLDIVPNHVGVATNENAWWNDVLENGPDSRYARYFDIAWSGSPRPQLHDKVLLPLLGGPYGQVLEKGELKLKFEGGAFAVHYYDRRFPIAPRSYGRILGTRPDALHEALGGDEGLLREYRNLVGYADDLADPDEARGERRRPDHGVGSDIKQRLAALAASAPVRAFIEQNVADLNGRPGDPRSFDGLDDLLDEQNYRLSYWRVAPDEINYRRFFDINDLAALSMEREEVFRETHQLILRLVAEGKVQGLRADHPDGLYDPKQYFVRLREAAAASGNKDLYVVAEKILAPDEPLPEDWPVHGTTGYDFLNMVNGLFVDPAAEEFFTRFYAEFTNDDTPYEELVYQKKGLILDIALASELQMLAHRLDRFAQKHRGSRDYTLAGLRHALRELIACFPVYRSYISRDDGVRESDRRHMETAVERASRRNPKTDPAVFHFIRDVVLQEFAEAAGEDDRSEQLRFAGKFQQVTAPVTAKGVEDTAFYVYNRFVSLNEVGGEPGQFGVRPEALHAYLADRQKRWPFAMSALSTHDTKRSEDVRARLNVLSEMPREWGETVKRWREMNASLRQSAGATAAPTANDEYLIYQTLVGAHPLDPFTALEYTTFVERVRAYMEKAMREAKIHTSWTSPNAEYEGAVKVFIAGILSSRPFLEDFRRFHRGITGAGLLNSLSQAVLKLTAPGVPDTYQGTELWDFSLVDPDNRRPVDYDRRRQMLDELKRGVSVRDLLATMEDGRVKMFVTWRLLQARRNHPGLFSAGEYVPLHATGPGRDHVFAFLRTSGANSAIVAVPRLMTMTPSEKTWSSTRFTLPEDAGPRFRNLFTDETVAAARDGIVLSDLFDPFPVAVLVSAD